MHMSSQQTAIAFPCVLPGLKTFHPRPDAQERMCTVNIAPARLVHGLDLIQRNCEGAIEIVYDEVLFNSQMRIDYPFSGTAGSVLSMKAQSAWATDRS